MQVRDGVRLAGRRREERLARGPLAENVRDRVPTVCESGRDIDGHGHESRLAERLRIRRISEFRRPQDVVVPAASSDEQRARVLTGVKAIRFAPPPASRGGSLSARKRHTSRMSDSRCARASFDCATPR